MDRREVEEVVEMTVQKTVPKAVMHTLEHYGFEVKNPTKVQAQQRFLAGAHGLFTSALSKILLGLILTGSAAVAVWAFGAGKIGG